MYTKKILYIPLFISVFLLFISIIIGISLYSSEENKYKNNVSNYLLKTRNLEQNNCCCCQCCNCCKCNSENKNNTSENSNDNSENNDENPKHSSEISSNINSESSSTNIKKDDDNSPNNNNEEISQNILRLKDNEKNISISIFIFSIFFNLEFFCFLNKYGCLFELNCCFCIQFWFTIGPLVISFILNFALFIIRIKCQNSYISLFGKDIFLRLNGFLIFLNFFQMFLIILIILLLVLIFFVSTERLCEIFNLSRSEICINISCECSRFKNFFSSICEKKENKKKEKISLENSLENSSETERKSLKTQDKESSFNSDIDNLLGQKILIVMLYYVDLFNIDKIFENNGKKTVKEAVSTFGIEIIGVNNYEDAIKELTKNEKGKCPYYACWLINNRDTTENTNQFLEILIKFWRNGGAVVLFSDNSPFIVETNLFLSKINIDFKMEGDYIGKKEIFGDETGLLESPGLFNRNKRLYKYNNIQRQSLSHNLYKIYEGETISSITKNNKRKMDVTLSDIKPFIPFARDTEGGITSLLYLANDSGQGDLILDGGFTKLFSNMEENGTFRYVQNIARFTARPEVHNSKKILPKDYRPEKVSL